jgi:histidinol dehydrogenase
MKRLDWSRLGARERAQALKRPSVVLDAERRATVARVIADVRARGDLAVRELTKKFDGCDPDPLLVPAAEIDRAWDEADPGVRAALTSAAARIETFHRAQKPADVSLETSPGVLCERRWVPLEAVGLYAPGGSAPLVSTVLMVGIPARLAGCPVRVLATPPGRDGRVDARLLAAAKLAGITMVVRAGGAQALAALA